MGRFESVGHLAKSGPPLFELTTVRLNQDGLTVWIEETTQDSLDSVAESATSLGFMIVRYWGRKPSKAMPSLDFL